MKTIICAMVILIANVSYAGNEGYFTGNDFLKYSEGSLEQKTYILGMVTGVSGMSYFFKDVCLPAGSNFGQLEKVAIKYMDNNPKDLHFPGVGLVFEAFKDAYPCKPAKKVK